MSLRSRPKKPGSVSDLDPFLRTRNNARWIAHIPDGSKPLCVDNEDAFGVEWVEDLPEFYPGVDEWFSLCDRCLERLDDR